MFRNVPLCVYHLFKSIICVGLSSILIQDVIQKNITCESYQAVKSHFNEKLMPPVLTICPWPDFKSSGPSKNDSYSAGELFHPITLTKLRHTNLYNFNKQNSLYYGLIQKLTAKVISEFLFEIIVKDQSRSIHSENDAVLNKTFISGPKQVKQKIRKAWKLVKSSWCTKLEKLSQFPWWSQ